MFDHFDVAYGTGELIQYIRKLDKEEIGYPWPLGYKVFLFNSKSWMYVEDGYFAQLIV